jgi:hypothetical protein
MSSKEIAGKKSRESEEQRAWDLEKSKKKKARSME